MNRLILLASILICVGCNSSEPVVLVFDLPAIAGKTPDEVVEILGKPDRIEETLNKGRQYPKWFWTPQTPNFDGNQGFKEHSIVFVDGKSDWISIGGTGSLNYNVRSVLQSIKVLSKAKPTVVAPIVTRWENGDLEGYKFLSIFKTASGNVSGIHVDVYTEP
jgi:hypothetical protein